MSRSTPLALGAVSTVSAMIVLAGCYYYYFGENGSADNCLISLGEYEGPVFTGKETISNDKCLVGSKWMQLRQHTLRSPTDGVIDDWLFIDYHDRVNVLAEIGGDEHTVGDFQVVRQKKYALETTSLAVVGGIVEQGDADVESAARRELREELGLVTEKLVPLGRYRTDSNRGAGWVNSFLARNCEPAPPKPAPAPKPKQHPQQPEEKKREDEEDEKNGRRRRVLLQGEAPQEGGSRELEQEDNSKESERRGYYHHLQRTASSGDGKKEKGGEGSKGERGGVEQGGGGGEEVYREVGEPDLEYQRPVRLTFKELWGSLARGAFKEVQWSNTVALAALHLLQTDLQSESNLSVLWPLHPPPPPKEPPDMTPKGMQPKGPRRRPPVVA